MTPNRKGLVHLYTGNGKGKTSAALGLALRAAGQGLSVCIVQFAKATDFVGGEISALELIPNVEIVRFGDSTVWGGLMPKSELPEGAAAAANAAFDYATEAIFSGRWDVVILDELNVVIDLGLLDLDSALHAVGDKPDSVELVLTGRGAPQELIDACDLVTEMADVRHPASQGMGPRPGIEY